MTNQQGAPEALRVEAAYGGDGKFIGYRLLSSGASGGLLVWADQKAMPGFRIGDHFVPGYQEVIEYKPVALVEAQQPAKAESLRQILTDPENQPNQYGVQFLMHGPKMAFKIGARQFTLDYEPTEPGEFEFMRDALIDAFSVFTPDVKMAQQPAPSAAAALPEGGPPGSGGWEKHAIEMERQRDHYRQRCHTMEEHQNGGVWYWQGDDGDNLESMGNSMLVVIRADQLRLLIAAPQPSPTPQADSAPGAVTVERAIQIAASLGVREYGPNTRNWSFEYSQLARFVAAITAPQADSQPAPIDMVLHCPACGLQHIDAPDERTPDWKNEPHRSHLCHGCGHIWRPADVPTNGVKAVKTTGKADSPIAARATADNQPAPEYVGNGMFKGETIQKAAEHWANWCDVRCMTGLSEFLRVVAARAPADSVLEDAARYRWLRDEGFTFADVDLGTDSDGDDFVAYRIRFHLPEPAHSKFEDDDWTGPDIDAAIDAAMKAGGAR